MAVPAQYYDAHVSRQHRGRQEVVDDRIMVRIAREGAIHCRVVVSGGRVLDTIGRDALLMVILAALRGDADDAHQTACVNGHILLVIEYGRRPRLI